MFSFVHLPTLCIHTSCLNESNLISSQYSSMKCFISSLLCFCEAQFLLLLFFFSALEEPDKTIGRGGPSDGISYVNFVEDKFFFLNITTLGGNTVDDMPVECSFACLDTPSCFSFNLAAFPDISNKLLCELLPSDKYNNSDKFMQSDTFHHFSIAVSRVNRREKKNRQFATRTAKMELSYLSCQNNMF